MALPALEPGGSLVPLAGGEKNIHGLLSLFSYIKLLWHSELIAGYYDGVYGPRVKMNAREIVQLAGSLQQSCGTDFKCTKNQLCDQC